MSKIKNNIAIIKNWLENDTRLLDKILNPHSKEDFLSFLVKLRIESIFIISNKKIIKPHEIIIFKSNKIKYQYFFNWKSNVFYILGN